VENHKQPAVAASIEKPIHNVKVLRSATHRNPAQGRKFVSSYLELFAATGGAYRDRTDDPLLAKQVLSQLS
jgi:hypothetical protein